MDLSNVPLQVLEKVRNKWVTIHDPKEDWAIIHHTCAMCAWVGLLPCYHCPIVDVCHSLLVEDAGWHATKTSFLASINAEIARRAGM